MAGQPDAIVLGSGPAGLLAVAALDRQRFDVVILDQDQPPPLMTRVGTVFRMELNFTTSSAAGSNVSTSCFPAMWTPGVNAGGAVANAASPTHVYESGIQMPERALGLQLVSAPRR